MGTHHSTLSNKNPHFFRLHPADLRCRRGSRSPAGWFGQSWHSAGALELKRGQARNAGFGGRGWQGVVLSRWGFRRLQILLEPSYLPGTRISSSCMHKGMQATHLHDICSASTLSGPPSPTASSFWPCLIPSIIALLGRFFLKMYFIY